jgi:hypothetical protein
MQLIKIQLFYYYYYLTHESFRRRQHLSTSLAIQKEHVDLLDVVRCNFGGPWVSAMSLAGVNICTTFAQHIVQRLELRPIPIP